MNKAIKDGETVMSNVTFGVAVNKFFYYANNWGHATITYPTLFEGEKTETLPDFFKIFAPYEVEHMKGKFVYWYEKLTCRGALMGFYSDLDGNNRAKLLAYINENYHQTDGWGISLNTLNSTETEVA